MISCNSTENHHVLPERNIPFIKKQCVMSEIGKDSSEKSTGDKKIGSADNEISMNAVNDKSDVNIIQSKCNLAEEKTKPGKPETLNQLKCNQIESKLSQESEKGLEKGLEKAFEKTSEHGANIGTAGRVKVNIYPQDPLVSNPSIIDIRKQDIGSDLNGKRFAVSIRDQKRAVADPEGNYLYSPGTPEFDQVNSMAIASRTLEMYEIFGGHRIEWAFENEPLKVEPHSIVEENACYNEGVRAIQFGSFKSNELNKTVQLCQSLEVVSHETGHAVARSLRPRWFDEITINYGNINKLPIGSIEPFALEEAFCDCTSMLMTLMVEENVKAIAKETAGHLRTHNRMSDLIEEYGMASNIAKSGSSDKKYLRTAINDFKYEPPVMLPQMPTEDDNELAGESHSFSRVFTAAFYECFANIFEKNMTYASGGKITGAGSAVLGAIETVNPFSSPFYSEFSVLDNQSRNPNNSSSTGWFNTEAIELALIKTRDVMGQILIMALDMAPPTALSFGYKGMALCMIKADELLNKGKNKNEIINGFINRKVISEDDVKKYASMQNMIPQLICQDLPASEEDAVKWLKENEKTLTVDASQYKYMKTTRNNEGFTYIQFLKPFEQTVELPDKTYEITRNAGLSLTFNMEGRLVFKTIDEL